MRRHVQRVRRGRCDVGVGASGSQAERCMIGVVERVDDEVRRAGMPRILGEHFARDRGRERLAAKARIAGPHRAEQRQRVPSRDLVIVGPTRVELGQILGIRAVARELVVGAVIDEIDRLEQGALLRQSCFRDALCARRRERLEHALAGLAILLGPERVVVAHGLAPVGEREARVEGFALRETQRRLRRIGNCAAL